jgi:MinD-like ATPase involved in chromosome partitioning or flagellar assembly
MTNQQQPPHTNAERPTVDPWAAPSEDPWAPAPARRDRRSNRQKGQPSAGAPGATAPAGAAVHTPRRPAAGAPSAFESAPAAVPPGAAPGPSAGVGSPLDGDRRRLAKTAATGGGLGRLLRAMFTADRTPSDMAGQAALAQAPVATGRRIAVVSTRGGAGKTTSAALLARLFSAVRPDTVAVLDLDPGQGSLGLRLGMDAAPPIDAVVPHATGGKVPSAAALGDLLGHAAPNLFASGPRQNGPGGVVEAQADAAALRATCAAVSRYFPVTLLDCPTGFDAPATQAALADCHAALYVVPATLSGMEDALGQLARWRRDPRLARIPLSVLVLQQDKAAPLAALDQAGRLSRLGFDAYAIGYDRHLAAGSAVALPLLGPDHRVSVATIAGQLLQLANGVR